MVITRCLESFLLFQNWYRKDKEKRLEKKESFYKIGGINSYQQLILNGAAPKKTSV